MAHNASVWRRLKALSRWFGFWITLAALTVTLVARATAAQAQQTEFSADTQVFTVGVLSTEGATRALEAWRPTVEYLNREALFVDSPYRFVVRPYSHATLMQAIQDSTVDFALTNPAMFVTAEVESGARAVLSQARFWEGRTYNEVGALVFARADSPVRQINQLRGGSVMAVAASDFSGWWLAEQEFRRRRLDVQDMLSELVFSGGNQREVVYAVQSGLVDAGVVPAGVLEELAAEGVINLDEFIPLSPMAFPDYPFWVSTPLYPEWVLSALPDVPDEALALMINSMLSVEAGSVESVNGGNVVWQAPQNYQDVHDLLISLRVRPYENYLIQATARIYRSYKWVIFGMTTFIICSLLFLILQLRRNIMLAEQRKDVLESEIRSKIFYRSAVEEHTVFLMLRPNGRISHVNENFCETTGRERDGLMGTFLKDILPAHEQEILEEEIMKSVDVGAPWDGPLKILKEDGSVAWAQCTVIPVSGSGEELSEIAVVATDMTQTRKGISEESFNNSLELIEDQVVVFRPGSMEMLYCNRTANEKLIENRIGGSWHGRAIKDILTDTDVRALQMRCETLEEGPQRRMTWEVTGNNGIPYEISLEYVQPDNDEPRFISIYRDITDRKVAEKAKNEFVATVSHELRTPLTSMKGALGLAKSGAIGELTPQMDKMIGMAADNCDRLVLLINDMLDMEKIEQGKMDFKMAPIDVLDVVEKAIESNKFYAEKFKCTMRLNLEEDGDGFMAMGDKDRLTQVMDNLMSNASKFSGEGKEIIATLKIHRGRLRFTLRDFGRGIPKPAHATIFDKFTQADMGDTRSQGGTGLGLAVAKLIVESHKGEIFFATEDDIGTEFFVDLPRMVGDKVMPFEPIEGEPVAFTGAGLTPEQAGIADAAMAGGPVGDGTEMQVLLAQMQSGGFEVELETGSVTVSQVVSGKGVVGQSSIFNWLSDDGRSLVTEMFERETLSNLKVSVLQAKSEDSNMSDGMILNSLRTNMYSNWLSMIPNMVTPEGGFKLMSVGQNDLPSVDAEDVSMMEAGDVPQALVLAENDQFDAVLHFDKIGLAHCMTIIPVTGGRLPESLPVIVMVTQIEAPEAERGVVSKFARPSGAGRGKARRRARG
ncbi:MAG: PhnD/SsuA/transferrin family substrate-binding protein [Cognatishimia sp.]|uniref:PhnD/SsuA/transferrin family substrate-binding protein n=1 Tax=Cognatishimia sp. TaxID=2211648 RepID=UPI003B8B5AF0